MTPEHRSLLPYGVTYSCLSAQSSADGGNRAGAGGKHLCWDPAGASSATTKRGLDAVSPTAESGQDDGEGTFGDE